MYKVDLHTHSTGSADGGITLDQYRHILESGILDCVAITDHGTIHTAREIRQELGDKIIVGEEIMAEEGEIIGLYLEKPIINGLSAEKTIRLIREQGGIVYIPHPFETRRKGLQLETLDTLIEQIDAVEVCNGRALLQNRSSQAVVWSRLNHVPGAASSDAHGWHGIGSTYMNMAALPTRATILNLIQKAKLITTRPTVRSLLYPSLNRTRNKVRKK